MSRRVEISLLVLLIVGTLVRVAATHRVFSATVDEPTHITAGYRWWHDQTVGFDYPHPPLARLICAFPLRHFPNPPDTLSQVDQGNWLLYQNDKYEHNIALARRGNLLFLAAALLATWIWARRKFSRGTALLAVAILGSMPPILAHAGLMTTDMAVAATVPFALIAFERWLDERTLTRAAIFGIALGFGLLSKFSFIVFFPVCAIALLATRVRALRDRRGIATLLVAVVIGCVLLWSGYFFDVGRMADRDPSILRWTANNLFSRIAERVPLPAPYFWLGLHTVDLHNEVGHLSFLLGKYSEHGSWYYFPVVFFFKTPLPFLVLLAFGARKRSAEFLLMPLALMLSVLPSAINIGVRHILPIYPPLCVAAAVGATAMWNRLSPCHPAHRRGIPFAAEGFRVFARNDTTIGKIATIALLAWLFAGVAIGHPDYLAWFNEFAGSHPERIAVDSNLDWGQDILRLGKVGRAHHIDHGYVLVVSSANISAHGYPADDALPPFRRTKGWIAVSYTALALDDNTPKGGYDWLKRETPVELVGRSIRLYHVTQ